MRGNSKKNIIMIADDDMFVRKVIATALQDLVEIVEVTDGKDVEEVYKRTMPDMLFLDVHLPTVSGLELLSRISKLDPAAHVIMISGDSSIENVKRAKLDGCRGFLSKPFDKKRLTDLLMGCPSLKFTDETWIPSAS